MWERVEVSLPPDVASVTTSVWLWPGVMMVGVMLKNFLNPPILWGQPIQTGFRNLRHAPEYVTMLQQMLAAPTVYAEAELSEKRNQALLTYLGFQEMPEVYDRKLYRRSI